MGSCFSSRLGCQCYCNRRRRRHSNNNNNNNGSTVSNNLSSNTSHYHNQNEQSNDDGNFINSLINDALSLNNVPTGRNKRLKKDKFKWKSDVSLNELELEAKRDEFWDTAPAFGGRVEIWNALKAICNAIDTNQNYELAQAIVDSVQIIIPNGTLTDCYDELGNHYQLPNYVITKPINLRKTTSKTLQNNDSLATVKNENDASNAEIGVEKPDIQLKFRLSTSLNNNDLKIVVKQNETIEDIKKRIYELKQIEPLRQRMYFGGKFLNDRIVVRDLKLEKNFVIQVIVRDDVKQPQQKIS